MIRRVFAFATVVCAVFAPSAHCESVIDTRIPGSDSVNYVMFGGQEALYGDPGPGVITAFGQTFHVTPQVNTITDFTVSVDNNDRWEFPDPRTRLQFNDPVDMYAYILEWSPSTNRVQANPSTGAPDILYQSSRVTIGSQFNFNFDISGGLDLDPNQQYVALFTGFSPGGSAFDNALGYARIPESDNSPNDHPDGLAPGEQAVFLQGANLNSFSELANAVSFLTSPRDLRIVINGLNNGPVLPPSSGPPVLPPQGTPEPTGFVIWGIGLMIVGRRYLLRRSRRRSAN